jgi:8-hydroxy-5-deazaflavin:NADPH oxidoreductase
MDVTIIGTGDMANGIGRRLLAGGHRVALQGTSLAKAESLATQLDATGTTSSVRVLAPDDEPHGDVVVFAVPYAAVGEIVDRHSDALAGGVVVDITNPVDWETREHLVVPADSSGAEEIAARLGGRTAVVKAFNTTFANALIDGAVAGHQLDVLIAGDDENAKQTVAQLVEDGGMRAIDAGPLRRARQLEQLGFLHILLQGPLATGYASAVKIVA